MLELSFAALHFWAAPASFASDRRSAPTLRRLQNMFQDPKHSVPATPPAQPRTATTTTTTTTATTTTITTTTTTIIVANRIFCKVACLIISDLSHCAAYQLPTPIKFKVQLRPIRPVSKRAHRSIEGSDIRAQTVVTESARLPPSGCGSIVTIATASVSFAGRRRLKAINIYIYIYIHTTHII